MTENDLNDEYSKIKKDEYERREKIEKQINNISIRQQELQRYILLLDAAVTDLDIQIHNFKQEKPIPFEKINRARKEMAANIELINDIHKNYNGYEDTKLRCQKEINDSTFKHNHLIQVSIRQLDEKANKYGNDDYLSMLMALNDKFTNANKNMQPVTPQIIGPNAEEKDYLL